MKWMVRYALVALITLLTTFCALAQVGKFEVALALLVIVLSVYFVLTIVCMIARRIWRR